MTREGCSVDEEEPLVLLAVLDRIRLVVVVTA